MAHKTSMMQYSVMSFSNSKIRSKCRGPNFRALQGNTVHPSQLDANKALKKRPFNFLTKEMKGDGPTGDFFSANYYQKINNLKKKKAAGHLWSGSQENANPLIYHKMIKKLEEYQEEPLQCEALVMATFLHPAFHLRFFFLIAGQK
ncbi:hypothetical protein VP01_174g3 [Puccinia sorghi]|uniref:Uncharacterized protein n=1 Tax=Puccinia sorghi TaxID=27349 RepID=A0A0L6VFP3_9BASI|nr:hypothetical protein VP01_174g3 [Puccinia sorghi]